MSAGRTSRAVLFDLDGTLIDTTNLILKCFEHSWTRVCGTTRPREVLLKTFGMPLRTAMQRLLAELADCDEVKVDRLVAEYKAFNVANHDALAQPFAGARESLEALKSRGYRLGVVTSKGRELGTRGLKLFGLDGLIDAAVFLEDTTRHKPDPDPIRAGLERLGSQAAAASYVGDSPHDITAGRAAGVKTIAALWGPGDAEDLRSQSPDHLAESPEALLSLFA